MEDEEGRKLEPYEEATVECPTEFTGACVDLLGSRAGQMLDMQANDVAGTTTIKYRVPTGASSACATPCSRPARGMPCSTPSLTATGSGPGTSTRAPTARSWRTRQARPPSTP